MSVMPMTSTTKVTILRNTGLGSAVNDPLPVVSVADGVRIAGAPARVRTGGRAAMTHAGVDTLQAPSIAAHQYAARA